MSRSIHYCPNCETECFDDVPCSKCGLDPADEEQLKESFRLAHEALGSPVYTPEKESITDNRDNWRKSYQKTFVNPELNKL